MEILVAITEVRIPQGFVELNDLWLYGLCGDHTTAVGPPSLDVDDLLVSQKGYDALSDFCQSVMTITKLRIAFIEPGLSTLSSGSNPGWTLLVLLEASSGEEESCTFAPGEWTYAHPLN